MRPGPPLPGTQKGGAAIPPFSVLTSAHSGGRHRCIKVSSCQNRNESASVFDDDLVPLKVKLVGVAARFVHRIRQLVELSVNINFVHGSISFHGAPRRFFISLSCGELATHRSLCCCLVLLGCVRTLGRRVARYDRLGLTALGALIYFIKLWEACDPPFSLLLFAHVGLCAPVAPCHGCDLSDAKREKYGPPKK